MLKFENALLHGDESGTPLHNRCVTVRMQAQLDGCGETNYSFILVTGLKHLITIFQPSFLPVASRTIPPGQCRTSTIARRQVQFGTRA